MDPHLEISTGIWIGSFSPGCGIFPTENIPPLPGSSGGSFPVFEPDETFLNSTN